MYLPTSKLSGVFRHCRAFLLVSLIFTFAFLIFNLGTAYAVPNDGTNYLKSSNLSGGGTGAGAGDSISSTDYKIIRSTVGEVIGGSPKSTDVDSICEAGGNGVCKIQPGWLNTTMKFASSGNFTSKNILGGTGADSVVSFTYTLPTLPTGTTASVQFSQNGTNWYNSSGTLNASNTMATGTNTISLSALGWATPFLYYKVTLTGPGNKTPALDSISTYYSGPSKLRPVFVMSTTDAQSDYMKYKIDLCTNLAMTASCQTFNQTTDATGWSEMDTQGATAYKSGTQAYYTPQADLAQATTYYWRSFAIDPAGSNDWSLASEINNFTTGIAGAPTGCNVAEVFPDTSQIRLAWTDNSNIEDYHLLEQSFNGGGFTLIQSLLPNSTLTNVTLSTAGIYRYRVRIQSENVYSSYCTFPVPVAFPFPQLRMEGILFR